MSVNGIGSSNNLMGARMSTSLTVGRQSAKVSFGERVQAGMNNVAGAVAGGLGTVAGMVGGSPIVSAAVSTVTSFNGGGAMGAGAQYQGMVSGVTGVPGTAINTTVGNAGPGFVGGTVGNVGTGSSVGTLAGTGGSPTSAAVNDPQLNSMFAEQKKLLGLQAAIGQETATFQTISNVLKARQDAAKNSIQNVR